MNRLSGSFVQAGDAVAIGTVPRLATDKPGEDRRIAIEAIVIATAVRAIDESEPVISMVHHLVDE